MAAKSFYCLKCERYLTSNICEIHGMPHVTIMEHGQEKQANKAKPKQKNKSSKALKPKRGSAADVVTAIGFWMIILVCGLVLHNFIKHQGSYKGRAIKQRSQPKPEVVYIDGKAYIDGVEAGPFFNKYQNDDSGEAKEEYDRVSERGY